MNVPEAPARAVPTGGPRIIPTAFVIRGSTVFSQQVLQALVAPRVHIATDLAGLNEAARDIRSYYRDQGYLLADVYLPEQALKAEGGPVTLVVVEAKVGRVTVRTADARVSAATAQQILKTSLRPGDLITEEALDKPVLLLRDLPGHEATATVEPGALPGEADVLIDLRSTSRAVDVSVGLDNHGTRAAGSTRAFVAVEAHNPGGSGDALQARAQVSNISDTRLFRLSYVLSPIKTTRATVSATRTQYALGGQFAALGATGQADILGISVLHPLVRTRARNSFLTLALEHKVLHDGTLASPPSDRRVTSLRLGMLGNFSDEVGNPAFTSFAANATVGRATLDDTSLAVDQGVGGLRTAGQFGKLGLEAQRAQYFAGGLSAHLSLQVQLASKNLSSAEKMTLGGPAGVRGYAVGEGVGDSGALLAMEARYQPSPSWQLAGEPASLTMFYDIGTIRYNQNGTPGGSSGQTLDSAGLGLLAGRSGNYLLSASLAWRIGSPLPTGSEPDRSPRFWLSTQKWF